MARQTGARPARLDGPPCPPELDYLWRWFVDIHAGRALSGMGPNRASHADIAAWCWLTGHHLTEAERRAIAALGATWVAVMSEKTAIISPPPSSAPQRKR